MSRNTEHETAINRPTAGKPADRTRPQTDAVVQQRRERSGSRSGTTALGTTKSSVSNKSQPPETSGSLEDEIAAFRRRRNDRYVMRNYLRRGLGGTANVSKCGSTARPDGQGGTAAIEVRRADATGAYMAGVLNCSSPWMCPVCTPKIMTRRGRLIDDIADATDTNGGTSLFVSLTGRHYGWDNPADLVKVMTAAIGSMLSGRDWAGDSPAEIGRKHDRDRQIASGGRTWRRAKPPAPIKPGMAKELGYVGQVRVIEVTDGLNGLHPHVHASLVFDRDLSDVEELVFTFWLRRRWAAHLKAATGRLVDPKIACDVRRWTTTDEQEQRLGWYVTKIAQGWSLGRELAGNNKQAKGKNRNIAQLVADYTVGRAGDEQLGQRLREIHKATLGKKAFYVSPNLLVWCGLDGQDQEDEEIANEDQDGHTIAEISQPVWTQIVRQHGVPDLLTGAEADGLPGLMEAFADLGIPVEVRHRTDDLAPVVDFGSKWRYRSHPQVGRYRQAVARAGRPLDSRIGGRA